VRALAVEVTARAALDEALGDEFGNRAVGCVFRAVHSFRGIAAREREVTVVAAVVDGGEFNEDAARIG
jgi:hypothetical protein